MSRVVALGEPQTLEGFTLAGVQMIPTEDPQQARTAWSELDSDVAVVILTPSAKEAISELLDLHPEVIWTTLPD